MVVFVVVLLVLWLIFAVLGFAIKGLLWLALIGIILFIGTVIITWSARRSRRAK